MSTLIIDFLAITGFVLFVLVSLVLFSSLPNFFIKFVFTIMALASAWAAYTKIPKIEFALFIGCLGIFLFYLLLKLADRLTRTCGVSIFQKKEEKKQRYFRF